MQQDRGRPVAGEGGHIGVVHNGGQEEEANCVVEYVAYYFYSKRNQFLVLF